MLRHWRRQYQVETTLEAKKQRALTKFGFTAERPDGRTAKAMSHAPGVANELGMGGVGGCAR